MPLADHRVFAGALLTPCFIARPSRAACFHIELAIGQCLCRGSLGVWVAISPYLGGEGTHLSLIPARSCWGQRGGLHLRVPRMFHGCLIVTPVHIQWF